jgi:hypothetical protein
MDWNHSKKTNIARMDPKAWQEMQNPGALGKRQQMLHHNSA